MVSVFRYHRQKTRHKDSKVLAVIPMSEPIAGALRAVPSLTENPKIRRKKYGSPIQSPGGIT
jgi:hypothetical protein